MALLNDALHDLKYNFVLVLLPFLVVGFIVLMIFNEKKASKQKAFEHKDVKVNISNNDESNDHIIPDISKTMDNGTDQLDITEEKSQVKQPPLRYQVSLGIDEKVELAHDMLHEHEKFEMEMHKHE